MRYILLSLMLGCTTQQPSVVMPGNNPLPECQVIFVGDCPHLWCVSGMSSHKHAGLEAISKTCEPKSAIVTSLPPQSFPMP